MRKNEANLTYKEHIHITGLNIQLYLSIIPVEITGDKEYCIYN